MAALTWDRRNGIAAAAALLVVFVCGVPLSGLLLDGLGSIDPRLWTRAGHVFLDSIVLAATVAIVATALGMLGALVLQHLPRNARTIMLVAFALPLLLPTYLHALSWADLLSSIDWIQRRGSAGNAASSGWLMSVWVLTVSYCPIATFIAHAALRRWDRSFDWSAWSHGQDGRSARRLRMSFLKAPLLIAGLLIFLLAFADFAIPDFFQVHTYATEVFVQVSSYLDTRGAIAMALPIVLMSAGAFYLLSTMSRRLPANTAYAGHAAPATAGSAVPAYIGAGVLALVFAAAPMMNLVRMAGDWATFISVPAMIAGDIGDGLSFAASVATLNTLLAAAVGYSMDRRHAPAGSWMRILAAMALAVPASLLGLEAIQLWNHPGPTVWIYDSGLALLLVASARWLPVGIEITLSGWRHVDRSQEEAGITSGMRWEGVLLRVLLPQLLPALVATFLVTFIFVFNELTLVTLLAPPGVSTVPLRIFQTVHYGPKSLLAAICLWQIIVLLVPIALLAMVAARASRARES